MRRHQPTLTAAQVQSLTEQLLTPLLGTWPVVRSCTLRVVIAVLSYAAARLVSSGDACLRLAAAPDADTVLGHLARQVGDRDQLDRRRRDLLAATLPRALRRGRWPIASDTTLIPDHGTHFHTADEIFRSQPKSGTTHFHCYATAVVCRAGLRYTLAVLPVSGGTPMADVVRELRRRIRAAGVNPRMFLLDRGFNNAGVVRYLQATRPPFVMPQAVHGRAPKTGPLTGLRAIRANHPSGWTTYVWKPNGKGERRVRVDLCVYRRRRRDRHGHRAFLYACWGVRRTPQQAYDLYRTRFGVETSYRQMNQVRVRTSTRNPALRLLFVAVALLLRNLWAYLHGAVLATPRRGGRLIRLERLRLRAMLAWLLHLVVDWFGRSDSTAADRPPREPLRAA